MYWYTLCDTLHPRTKYQFTVGTKFIPELTLIIITVGHIGTEDEIVQQPFYLLSRQYDYSSVVSFSTLQVASTHTPTHQSCFPSGRGWYPIPDAKVELSERKLTK